MREHNSNSVAIVGSGPSGLMTALELAHRGIPVTLFDAGPMSVNPSRSDIVDADIDDARRHAPMRLATRRGFGGTSALWAGRAVPFDAIDFAERPWAHTPEWPISLKDLAPWYEKAAEFLNCGDVPLRLDVETEKVTTDTLEHWCAQPNIGAVKMSEVRAHPKIEVVTDTTVTRLDIDTQSNRCSRLHLFNNGKSSTAAFRAIVVAAGGVETARLLLNSRVDQPELFGGPDGALGRYYMGHISGSISDIVFLSPGGDAQFDYLRDRTGHYTRRRFSLSPEQQARAKVLNLAAWPEHPVIGDAKHRSAELSVVYMALAAPIVGPRLTAPAMRARKLEGSDGRLWPHIANILRDPFGAAQYGISLGAARYLSRFRMPAFFVLNPEHRYSFFYHGEHAPNPDSRVTLTSQRDKTGMLRAHIDFRFQRYDAESIVVSLDLMARELSERGIAKLVFTTPQDERVDAVLAQANDGFHQIGTARMAQDSRRGITDEDARVHGTSNLFLAGSSIFPTSGQANPTLTAVALASRLAAHLTDEFPKLNPED